MAFDNGDEYFRHVCFSDLFSAIEELQKGQAGKYFNFRIQLK